MANSASTPPLHREPRRIRPPFDCDTLEPVDDRQAEETADQWRAHRHADRVSALLEALDGIELGAYDVRIIEWLGDWEISTVGTVASLLYRARELGVRQAEHDREDDAAVCAWVDERRAQDAVDELNETVKHITGGVS